MSMKQIPAQLAESNTAFGFTLLRDIAARRPGTNVFISPVSVALALALAYNGAAAETARAIAGTLAIGPLDADALNAANMALLQRLAALDKKTAEAAMFWGRRVKPEDYKIMLKVASSLWLAQGVPINPPFVERCRAVYDAEVAPATDAATINGWVAGKTNNKIRELIQEVQPLSSYLINAVYFWGGWANPFPPKATAEHPFTLLDGSTKPVMLMRQREEFHYYEDERLQLISLPIGDADQGRSEAAMLVLLPRPGVDLAEFVAALDGGWWRAQMTQLIAAPRGEGTIALPRFSVEFAGTLNDTLAAMGMGLAFDQERADFSAVSPRQTWISRVIHKAYLKVNEQGCEAAAATAVEMMTLGFREPGQPFEMIVDRPFLCVIVEWPSAMPLFLGLVTDPQSL